MCKEMPTAVAVVVPVLITATSAVAGVPTFTERLVGKTAATKETASQQLLILATKASGPPLYVRSGPTTAGKSNGKAVKLVEPVAYALPALSTAMPLPLSSPLPPM